MNMQETLISELRREKRKIDDEFNRLKKEKEAIDITISRLSGNTQLSLTDELDIEITKPLGPTAAIRQLFEQYPTKKWYPGDIRDELNDMKKHKELATESKSILNTVHWILRGFVENEEVEKSKIGRRTWYRKLQNSQT